MIEAVTQAVARRWLVGWACRVVGLALFSLFLSVRPAQEAVAQGADAQSALEPVSMLFVHVTVADGLPHGQVRDLVQDRHGFMWFATAGGIARFDGYELTAYKYDPDDQSSLSSNNAWAVYEDRAGYIWIGTQDGLNRYDPATETFTRFKHDLADPRSLPHSAVRSIYEDRSGTLWVGTYGSGLSRYDASTESFTRFYFEPEDSVDEAGYGINTIYEPPSEPGVLWIATWGGGLGRFDTGAETFTYYRHDPEDAASLSGNRTISVLEDQRGHLWVGTEQAGLNRLDRRTGVFVRYRHDPDDPSSLGNDTVWDLYQFPDEPGALWVATDGAGLGRFDLTTQTFAHYRHVPYHRGSITHDRVKALYQDGTGLLWAATLGGGLSRTDRKASPFQHMTHQPGTAHGLNHPSVQAFAKTADEVLWVGTEYGGLNRLDRRTGAVVRYRHDPSDPSSLGSDEVTALHARRDGTLWVGFWLGGVDHFDPATGTSRPIDFGPIGPGSDASKEVELLHEDRHEQLWIGYYNDGLMRFDPSTGAVARYRHNPKDPGSLGHDRVQSLLEDRSGTLWVGTGGGGLSRFDPVKETFTTYRHDPNDPTSLSNNSVMALAEDLRGRLWIGTGGGGLVRFDPAAEAFVRFTEQNSDLSNNNVGSLLADAQGILWMGTDAALVRFDPRRQVFTTFAEEDGVRRQAFRTAYAAPDGEFFFGGRRGFEAFFPEQITPAPDPHAPPVVITGVTVDGVPVVPGADAPLEVAAPLAEQVSLSPRQRDVAFRFAALHYANPARNRYRYKLDGFDEAWHVPVGDPVATYTNLDPGRYVFRVQAANADGVWNERGAALGVVVAPFFYETWWFLALGVLGAAGLLFAGYRARVRRLRRGQSALEAQVAERTKALRAEKHKTEAQAERLVEMDHLKTRFFTNVSHEFRTPLTLTIGPLEDLHAEEDGTLPEPAREKVGLALKNSRRLLRLTNQLLDVAKLEAGEVRLRASEQDLAAFLGDLARAFVPLAERRRVDFGVDLTREPLLLYFDAPKLEHVFINLLSNAFKFTPEGGRIRVEAQADGDRAALVRVRDNGLGIPADRLPHLFERFYQVDEAGGGEAFQAGSGIGLSLAKDLAELHGGHVEVESAEGFGSTFTVRLPTGRAHLSDEQIATPAEAAPPETPLLPPVLLAGDGQDAEATLPAGDEPAAEDDRTTVLIADDNADIRAYVRGHLDADYRILEAADGAEALRKTRTALPDLVISDVMMPEMDGFALTRALKADRETDFIPVILLTAKATTGDRIEGLQDGADDYLTKPFDVRELTARVQNLIASRQKLKERFRQAAPQPAPAGYAAEAANERDGFSASDAAFLEQVRAAVENCLADEDFTVEDLAEAVAQSRSNLHRRMRLLVDESPSAFIRRVRLERAAGLLRQREGTVSEVAYAVGFKSVSHFSQSFRKAYGVTPSAYAG